MPRRQKSTDGEELMTPGEVAGLWRVDVKTVTRWSQAGKLIPLFTPGGHRRYRRKEVEKYLKPEEV